MIDSMGNVIAHPLFFVNFASESSVLVLSLVFDTRGKSGQHRALHFRK